MMILTQTNSEFAAANDATTFNGTALGADTVAVSAEAADKQNTGDFFGTDNGASGSISDASDTLTITNYKETTIDVGVILSDAPYVAMLILAGAAVLLYVRRRKTTIEE